MNSCIAETTLLAFDYGKRYIGVAIGSTITGRANTLTVIKNNNNVCCLQKISKLVIKWKPEHLVIGLPYYTNGKSHNITNLAIKFGNKLSNIFTLPVSWVDERYSSCIINTPKKNTNKSGIFNTKLEINAESARIILQQYFYENGFT